MMSDDDGAQSSMIPRPPPAPKQADNQDGDAEPQTSVTFIYQAIVADFFRNVTFLWFKNSTSHYLNIFVEKPLDEENPYTLKIDLKTWQFWGKKGLKSLDIDGRRVEVYWDMRQAKFSTSPEPCSCYYVAIVSGGEVAMLLGDLEEEAYKRTKKGPSPIQPTLKCKKEHLQGKRLFCTRTILSREDTEHDIIIESSSFSGLDDPEVWISIDEDIAIRIMNLHWRFRGNERISVNNSPIDIFWDVHDWLYNNPGDGPAHGLFIFKPGALDSENDSSNFDSSTFGSPKLSQNQSSSEFCYFLYAWKSE